MYFRRLALVALCLALGAPDVSRAQPLMPDFSPVPVDQTQHDMHQHGTAMGGVMSGALGSYAVGREASGTSWQPDTSVHGGVHATAGDWMLMGHAVINGVYDRQEGARGGEKSFVSGMIMGAARKNFGAGDTLNLRAMLSPDPFMGKAGYPLLLASGETADEKTHLVDRQHPHDLFMELSASYSHPLSKSASVFVYAGLPGEPAFGPPAFMHRASIMDSPEAPVSHHWLDSTHITFGVLTGGVTWSNWKLDASRFTGREPDATRYDIDHPRFDSSAVRLSWNPSPALSLQMSWAHLHSPEQLHPDENDTRWSASAIYTTPFAGGGWWSTTLAWGRKQPSGGAALDAWIAETALAPVPLWTFYARAERIDQTELGSGTASWVGKASLGGVKDFRIGAQMLIGIGGQYAFNWPGTAHANSYGGQPHGVMAFVRLKVG